MKKPLITGSMIALLTLIANAQAGTTECHNAYTGFKFEVTREANQATLRMPINNGTFPQLLKALPAGKDYELVAKFPATDNEFDPENPSLFGTTIIQRLKNTGSIEIVENGNLVAFPFAYFYFSTNLLNRSGRTGQSSESYEVNFELLSRSGEIADTNRIEFYRGGKNQLVDCKLESAQP